MRILYDAQSLTSFASAWVYLRAHPGMPVASGVPLEPGDTDLAKADPLECWQELFGGTPPWLLSYVADRALGHLESSQELNAAVDSYPRTFPVWDWLASIHDPLQQTYGRNLGLVGDGRTVLRYRAQQPK
jgi:hypothetical protein